MRFSPGSAFFLSLVFLLVASYFALFNQLGKAPMHLWDESSYALNAQEMLETGKLIDLQLLGKPDLYNTKPPFAIWCMALGVKLFGFNELGARIASACFGLFSVLVLFGVGLKLFSNRLLSLGLPLVLISSVGFVNEHITRTGDTDSILAFWILIQCISFYQYTLNIENRRGQFYLLLTALFVSMGCLTKGIAGLTALPGLFAWLVYTKSLRSLFANKYFYIGLGIFILLVPGYYWLRNELTPGYWDVVVHAEFGGRLEQQEFLNPKFRPFYYYYKSMVVDDRFLAWIFVLPLAIIYIIQAAASKLKSAGLFFVFALMSVSLLLAFSSTKLFWYDAPLYPLMSAVIGIAVGMFCSAYSIRYVLVVFAIWCWPYYKIVACNIFPKDISHFPEFFQELRQAQFGKDTINIINADVNFPLEFYVKQDRLKGNYSKIVFPNDSLLRKGDLILTEKYAREVDVNQRFQLDTLSTYHECSLYRIKDIK